ncbi:broad-complex core protein isoforms 1/2/3/4/5-like [Planococcus citri]|uniref:broad-complex core protein isoforms 1/2/3/4/5-like n=1 Tax=Planococcus citri TaxID=170843 RepID=UPI0031F8B824
MSNQQYCLRWKNHQPNFISVFSSLLSNETLVDVTLAAEGKHLQAHKVVLSACSPYFQELFSINPCQHPIVILKDISYNDLKAIVDFIYLGEINVPHDHLQSVIKTAESLNIKGLINMPIATLQAEFQAEKRTSTDLQTSYRRKRLKKHSTESFGSASGSSIEEIEVLGIGSLKNESSIDIKLHSVSEFPSDSQNQPTPEIVTPACASELNLSTSRIKSEDNAGGTSVITGIINKRYRLLTRQSHITKQDPDGDENSDIDLPPSPKRPLGRQYSDPTPQQNITSDLTDKSGFLTVPTSHLTKQNSDSALPSKRESSDSFSLDEDLKNSAILQQPRSNHCPMLRPGPALGCNFCWNTIDNHGRILRRKTKYHCPECRTNLCIVPCFQDYHTRKEDLDNENEHAKENQKDSLAEDSSLQRSTLQKSKTPSSSSV